MSTALAVALALLLDHGLGEPRRLHPLVGFGGMALWMERALYGPLHATAERRRMQGMIAVSLLLAPPAIVTAFLARLPVIGFVAGVLLLYLAVGMRSLADHAQRVRDPLAAGDLPGARRTIGHIVSRETHAMQSPDIARAAVESVLENGNDAVFGALFWFSLAGASGVLLYRLANTLDAMWGYRTPRYKYFGWAAARLDDVLNFVPARLTAMTYALLGNTRGALRCWHTQAPSWDSPNAGPVMAAGAGALTVRLGGPARYHGRQKYRPPLGMGRPAEPHDIERALRLVQRGTWLWLGVIALVAEGWRLV